ncbi:hypothetical protein [Chroococcidiopsis cubana]|nr:hypothetical protein [Chroococcidiopsis cubana]
MTAIPALVSTLVAVLMHSPKADASVYLQAEVEKDFDSSDVVWVQNGSSKTTEVAAYGIASDYVLSDELHEMQAGITNCWFRYKGETAVYRGWLGDENSSLVCKDTAERPAQYERIASGMYASKFEDYCLTLRKENRAARERMAKQEQERQQALKQFESFKQQNPNAFRDMENDGLLPVYSGGSGSCTYSYQ